MYQKSTAFLAAALTLLTVAGLRAQGNATIVGVVTDSSGAVVPGATVTLTNERTGLKQGAVSDAAGRYTFPQLAIGEYQIGVVQPGFKKFAVTGIQLTAEQALTVNVTLQLGQVSETLEVSGAVASLETVTSTVRTVVGHELIEDLPLNGRNALQLQTLI